MCFNVCQTHVGVPARPSPNHVLKQRQRRFANCYNCSDWRHHGYVSFSEIPSYCHNYWDFWAKQSWDWKPSLLVVYPRSAPRGGWSVGRPLRCHMFAATTLWETSCNRRNRSSKKTEVNQQNLHVDDHLLSPAVFPVSSRWHFHPCQQQNKKRPLSSKCSLKSSNASSFVCCSSQALSHDTFL